MFSEQILEERRFTKIEEDIKSLTEKVESLEESIKDLVKAWEAASFILTAIKWMAAVGAGCLAIYGYIKGVR